jgi:long-subunit acyl-CoA synthetase (AMP-forming)
VGIAENTQEQVLEHIIKTAKIEIMFCHVSMLHNLRSTPLTYIVCFGGEIPSDLNISAKVYTVKDVMTMGKTSPMDPFLNEKSDIFTIIFTSGSTGFPKGVVYTDRHWNSDMKAYPAKLLVGCSYQPISHIVDPHHVWVTLFNGGRIGFIPEITDFFHLVAVLKPTILMGAPRMYNKIYEECHLMEEKNMGTLLGGRCHTFVVGGAPLGKKISDFLVKTFKAMVLIGYGTTESGNISFNGGKISGNYKLLDCPDLGYSTKDTPNSRGELCVKNENMFSGYYNDPEKTKEAFTEDGYFKTGDIVEIHPNGECKVIARRKETYKLSNGEFYQPVSLEHYYLANVKEIAQIYIHGDSSRSYLVGISLINL